MRNNGTINCKGYAIRTMSLSSNDGACQQNMNINILADTNKSTQIWDWIYHSVSHMSTAYRDKFLKHPSNIVLIGNNSYMDTSCSLFPCAPWLMMKVHVYRTCVNVLLLCDNTRVHITKGRMSIYWIHFRGF